MTIKNIAVLGQGGVGALVATLCRDLGMHVTGVDRDDHNVPPGVTYKNVDLADVVALDKLMQGQDAVVCCLPYYLNAEVAKAAHKNGVHYFDPTEDVETLNLVRDLAKTSRAAMIPQNGLAPGFIGIAGAHLARKFDAGEKLRHIKMRVGALPQHPIGQLGYAFNWSPTGLVNECIKPCDVISDGVQQKVPALSDLETLRIEGDGYEAFNTSGGLGTMCETYAGKVETLNYKTIRYFGHAAGMKLLLEDLRFKDEPEVLARRMADTLPPDPNDRVLIYVSAQGKIRGRVETRTFVADYRPIEIAGAMRTAITWTTACSIVAVIEMVSNGSLPPTGFSRQEDIKLEDFLKTTNGSYYAKNHKTLSQGVL
jgi:saccharopine dehydrogenase-like NADP-dependent oxidoreductase